MLVLRNTLKTLAERAVGLAREAWVKEPARVTSVAVACIIAAGGAFGVVIPQQGLATIVPLILAVVLGGEATRAGVVPRQAVASAHAALQAGQSLVTRCVIHKSHSPAPLTIEVHHLVPVAWQLMWQPANPPFPGRDPDGRGELWDERSLPLCPTGHRNVHAWIVRLMHALVTGGEDPQQAFAAARGEHGGIQATSALLALTRFKEAGGSLQQLVAAGEWGES